MGNSKSQLKRSRSEYGSARSVAFSLPSSWDRRRRSYAYGEPAHRTPSIASSQSVASYPKPILRNSGMSYSNGVMNRTHISQSLSNLQTESQYEVDPGVSYSRSQSADRSQPNSAKPGLTRHQFNDIYLKNDLKKLFKSQDRSNSVAQVDEDPSGVYNSTASLDRRLGALKSQRMRSHPDSRNSDTGEPRKEGATEKRIRSKKAKKAPLPQNFTGVVPLPKVEGKYRKKRPAPAPPSVNHSRSQPISLPESAAKIPTTSTASLLDEIEMELNKNNVSGLSQGPESESIPIPKPDYDLSQRYLHSKPTSKVKGEKPIPPPKPVLRDVNSAKPLSIITSTSKPDTDFTSKVPSPAVQSTSSHTSSLQPTSNMKKEVREIATQYDAPVEIAIQCDGNTLRLKTSSTSLDNIHTSSSASLADLFQLFTQAARVSEVSNNASFAKSDDNQSLCSDSSSGRSRNSNQQKIVHMNEVLAGVPVPPPLPDHTNVKLIQMRTITENTPVSLAPTSSPAAGGVDDASSQGSPTPQRNFNTFQQELLFAYDRLNKKRKDNHMSPDILEDRRSSASGSSSNSSEASALKVFKHSETIMGITPATSRADAAIESDSGNDEPSDYGSSLSQSQEVGKSLPPFVLDDIARNFPAAECDMVSSKTPLGSEKSKFHSIKKIKRSMKNALNSISRGSSKNGLALSHSNLCDVIDDDVGFGNENWTFSGRSKTRQSVLGEDAFPSSANTSKVQTLGRHRRASLPRDVLHTANTSDLIISRKSFSQTNMNSFSLLTPTGYQVSSPEPNSHDNLTTTNASTSKPSRTAVVDSTVADIQL